MKRPRDLSLRLVQLLLVNSVNVWIPFTGTIPSQILYPLSLTYDSTVFHSLFYEYILHTYD